MPAYGYFRTSRNQGFGHSGNTLDTSPCGSHWKRQ